jgi:eukaryotic-like serine/threonine-protein kinase
VELHPGTIVAERYEVLGPLGRGGMGELYTARNLRTERRVALKLLRADAKFRADAIERFRREARAAGMISSEYVTQVFDVEDDPNWGIAIVFELLEGESLLERLRRTGPMTPAALHPYVTQILHGLVAAHAAGVIHRDLKPSNVYLERRPDGSSRIKILDFGISKLPKGMTKNTLTEPGQSLGSFMFMPPEQIHGAGRVDARADIYAVGTLAFQALTGHLPFDSTNIVELVRLKSSTNPRSLAEVLGRPTAPELEAWLARALARDVNARFQSAQEAAHAWAQLAPQPAGASPAMAAEAQASADAAGLPHSRPPPLPPRTSSSPSQNPPGLPSAAPWGQTGANPVVAPANHYQTGANPISPAANPYQTGANPYQTGANPYQTGANPYQTGANPISPGANLYSTGPNPVSPAATPYQTGANPIAPMTGGYPTTSLGPVPGARSPSSPSSPSHSSPPLPGPGAPTPPMGVAHSPPSPYFPGQPPGPFPPPANSPSAYGSNVPPAGFVGGTAPLHVTPPPLPPASNGGEAASHQNVFAAPGGPTPGPGYAPPPYPLTQSVGPLTQGVGPLTQSVGPHNAQSVAWQPASYATPLSPSAAASRPMWQIYLMVAGAVAVASLIVMAMSC